LQFGRNFTGLDRGGLRLLDWAAGRSWLGVFDHLAVHMHDLERSRLFGLHPTCQHVLELFGIDLFKQASKGSLAGHVILAPTAPARAAAQAAALSVIEAFGKFGNRVRPSATRRHRQGDQG